MRACLASITAIRLVRGIGAAATMVTRSAFGWVVMEMVVVMAYHDNGRNKLKVTSWKRDKPPGDLVSSDPG